MQKYFIAVAKTFECVFSRIVHEKVEGLALENTDGQSGLHPAFSEPVLVSGGTIVPFCALCTPAF
jgi:hypothetical protein